jgi:hypothetical protein
MKVYKVTAEDVWYDMYKSVVVVAESPEKALSVICTDSGSSGYKVEDLFHKDQGKITVTEITMDKETYILGDFHAG